MPYSHLSIEERETIDRMHYSGCPQSKIADALKRSPSTISRELSRNRNSTGYSARRAQCDSERRRRERPIDRKLDNPELNAAVRNGLAREWSPEQIAGRQRTEYPEDRTRHLSHQTIYRWLERACPHRSHFESFLRHGRYGKRGASDQRSGPIANRVPIAKRPEVVAGRSRYGDWEGDTVVGSGHQGAVVTLVERKSGYLVAGRMPDGRSASLNRATQRVLSPLPSDLLHTLTVDNGAEFARHESLSRALGMPIYFADPYCSNQRALNENTNGLLRQYYPKGTSFLDITHQDLARVVDRLNNRPRKRLNYQTPREVLLDAGFALEM